MTCYDLYITESSGLMCMQQLEMRAEYGSARAYYQQALTASGQSN